MNVAMSMVVLEYITVHCMRDLESIPGQSSSNSTLAEEISGVFLQICTRPGPFCNLSRRNKKLNNPTSHASLPRTNVKFYDSANTFSNEPSVSLI